MKRFKGHAGMSLVEVTIILLVLMLLTAVLAPSINDFVNDAKDVKVKEDCEAIGGAVMRLARDVGPCLKFTGTGTCDESNRVEILYSNGPDVLLADVNNGGAFPNTNLGNSSLNWDDDDAAGAGDAMEDQFTTNAPAYNTPGAVVHHNPLFGYQVPGPAFYLGWRGAYITAPIGPDPWGRRYLVNSVFLSTATDSNTPGEGERTTGWRRDAFCISGGRDVQFSTRFEGNQTQGQVPNVGGMLRQGDDFVYIISGDTR